MLALIPALIPALVLSQATRYTIDPRETELIALTKPAGLFSGASHSHVLLARSVTGAISYDPAAPAASSFTVSFPTDALENDDPLLRQRFNLTGTLSAEDRKTIGANLRAADQLDVKRFPTTSFTSSKVSKLDAGHLEISGTMTLRGVAVALTLPVAVSIKDGVLNGRGTVGITHAMFGFKPISVALGTIRNAEEITLDLKVTARAPSPDGGS